MFFDSLCGCVSHRLSYILCHFVEARILHGCSSSAKFFLSDLICLVDVFPLTHSSRETIKNDDPHTTLACSGISERHDMLLLSCHFQYMIFLFLLMSLTVEVACISEALLASNSFCSRLILNELCNCF